MSGRIKNALSFLLVLLILLGLLPVASVSADDSADEYYYSAYKDVLESYFSLASGLKKPESVPKYGDYYLFEYQGNIYKFGYTFLDYDNNGIKELIFSTPDNGALIYDMYTLENGNVEKVLGSWNRCRYILCGDGVIYMYGSGGAMTGSHGLYRYSGDKLTVIEEVYYDYYPNSEDPGMHIFITYSDTKTPFADEELTKDEWESKRTEYANMTKPIPVTPLYEYDDIFFASNQYNEMNRKGFVYKVADNEVSITNYFGYSSEVIIPDTIDGYPVTSIGESAFNGCDSLNKVIIPKNVNTIEMDAFTDCHKLESVIIPESVTFIGDDAFHNISGLTIYGYEGSYAESYALKNEIPFVALKESSVILGDANEDGFVNVKDATAIQKHLADLLTLSDVGIKLADADSSGGINIKDATAIQKHIADIETGFDIGSAIA
ncbi:MAG: leucine-rich repeat protein [Clostridia bacterium]|nr:leucine-rich repeat protein [Clostridia bacterium]